MNSAPSIETENLQKLNAMLHMISNRSIRDNFPIQAEMGRQKEVLTQQLSLPGWMVGRVQIMAKER